MKFKYIVTLREGLSPTAPIIEELGSAETFSDALSLAVKTASNPDNIELLGCRSYYIRQIIYKENECVGLDYGSYSKFLFITKMEESNV